MSLYSLITTVDLFSGIPGSSGTPYGNPANAILTDGSYCIAVWIEQAAGNQVLRVYRLGTDLTVLGQADIDTGFNLGEPTPYLVALPGNKVFMVSRLAFRSGYPGIPIPANTWASWVMDCSGTTPVPGSAIPMATGLNLGYDSGGIFDMYDQANDRIVLASAKGNNGYPYPVVVQTFRASTGVLLAETVVSVQSRPMGLYMDPLDQTKFKIPTKWRAAVLDFTVALNGSSITYDGLTGGGSSPDWPMAGGSSYLAGGGGFITNQNSFTDPHNRIEYWNYSGTSQAQRDRPHPTYSPNYDGDAACLMNGRHLVHVYEEADQTGRHGPVSCAGVFVGVDQLVTPPMIEFLELPYYGLPGGQYRETSAFWEQAAIVTADQNSGIILVTMTTFTAMPGYSPEYYSLFVWVIQGPGLPKPNLVGGPLGVDVHFMGG